MKKTGWILCATVLFTGLVTSQAMARPVWQSTLTCDLNQNGVFGDLDPGLPRPFASLSSSGDLYVSTIYGLPPLTPIACQVNCFRGSGAHTAGCGMTDAHGTLRAQRIPRLLSPGVCAFVDFFLYDPDDQNPFCVDGFTIDP